MRTRRVALGLAALAVVAVTVQTGGFTSVNAERGVAVDVAPDDEAFLGVEITEEGGDDRKAISFVGFCTANEHGLVSEGLDAAVTKYKPDGGNVTEEALAVEWSAPVAVSTVVLKTGGGDDALENVGVGGEKSGTAEVTGDTVEGQDARDYCPDGEHGIGTLDADDGDLGVADDAAPADGDVLRVRVTNRFAEPLTTVEVTAGGATRDLSDAGRNDLGPGGSVTVRFDDADCETVTVTAAGEGTEVSLERTCP